MYIHIRDQATMAPSPTSGAAMCANAVTTYRGTSLIRNRHPPYDHHRSLL